MRKRSKTKQSGLSLIGFILLLAVGGVVGVLGMKVLPTVTEYIAIKRAIVKAKDLGSSPAEIRMAFDKQADVAYITAIKGKNLVLIPRGGGYDVQFAYDKIIPLFGPASLLLEYKGTTSATFVERQSGDYGS